MYFLAQLAVAAAFDVFDAALALAEAMSPTRFWPCLRHRGAQS